MSSCQICSPVSNYLHVNIASQPCSPETKNGLQNNQLEIFFSTAKIYKPADHWIVAAYSRIKSFFLKNQIKANKSFICDVSTILHKFCKCCFSNSKKVQFFVFIDIEFQTKEPGTLRLPAGKYRICDKQQHISFTHQIAILSSHYSLKGWCLL